MKIPINLVVFDTAKGHFGRTNIYKSCIQDLDSKIPLSHFDECYVHIKVGEGEQDTAKEMIKWYETMGFVVEVTYGNFKHFERSHQSEYCRDMIKVFSDRRLTSPYTLWLESDWKWDDKGKDLLESFRRAVELLQWEKDILSVRFPRFLNEPERINNLKKKHGMEVECVKMEDFPYMWQHNDNFSCNPNICRTRDLYLASLILKRNFEQFAYHSEMGWTKCLSWMSDFKYSYAVFDPKEVSVLHCGTKEGEEDKAGQVWETI